jgi:hypothetical protein
LNKQERDLINEIYALYTDKVFNDKEGAVIVGRKAT